MSRRVDFATGAHMSGQVDLATKADKSRWVDLAAGPDKSTTGADKSRQVDGHQSRQV